MAEPLYADLRWCLALGFFAVASFAGFLPANGSSISLCPMDAFLGFFAGLDACSEPTLRRNASIRSTTLPAAGRSFGVIGLPARFWLMRSINAVSYWSSNLSGSKRPDFGWVAQQRAPGRVLAPQRAPVPRVPSHRQSGAV